MNQYLFNENEYSWDEYKNISRYVTGRILSLYRAEKDSNHCWDHQYSIKHGFRDRIKIEIIANPNNLKFITLQENNAKGKRSNISMINLIMGFKEWQNDHQDCYNRILKIIAYRHRMLALHNQVH